MGAVLDAVRSAYGSNPEIAQGAGMCTHVCGSAGFRGAALILAAQMTVSGAGASGAEVDGRAGLALALNRRKAGGGGIAGSPHACGGRGADADPAAHSFPAGRAGVKRHFGVRLPNTAREATGTGMRSFLAQLSAFPRRPGCVPLAARLPPGKWRCK